ncbi:MAG: glycosyltransferase family 4 protein [Planctomycetes bacterium]|nr:glycosyltransferase family 4 protein [Planctomycetota bacterium]
MSDDILFISRNFPPLTGGMERLMFETVKLLQQDYRVTLIGPKGSAAYAKDCEAVYELSVNPILFNMGALFLGGFVMLRKRFRLIIGGSGLVAPATSLLQTLFRTPSYVFVHGLDLVVDHVLYQTFILPMIRLSKNVIANSRPTAQLAQEAGIKEERISVLNPGTEIGAGEPVSFSVRDQHQLGTCPLMLYVGRIIERKGLLPFIEHSLPQIIENLPQAKLLVIGDDALDAVNQSKPLLREVRQTIQELQLQQHILFLGMAEDEVLNSAYREADVLIFPLVPTKGDVEGFGMVAIEAAACGTPTVAFAVGGVSDAVIDGTSGLLVRPQDYHAFTSAVLKAIKTSSEFDENCRAHAKTFDWSIYGRKLAEILDSP